MNEIANDDNPYRSPAASATTRHLFRVDSNSSTQLQVALVRKSIGYRHFRFTGRFDADVEWNGIWSDYLRINGDKLKLGSEFIRVAQFQFILQSPTTTFDCSFDVTYSLWGFGPVSICISIDGELVFGKPAT